MAKLQVVAVKDSAMGAFNQPFFVPATGLAIRSFIDEVNRNGEDNPMARHPGDFDLYRLGEFDTDTGRFEAPVDPEHLMRAKDAVKSVSAE